MDQQRIVIKTGGSLLKNESAIKKTALMIREEYGLNTQLVVVVSAMKGETARLRKLAQNNFYEIDPKFMDLLLSSGEQQACALMSMALKIMGRKPFPMIAHQIPIVTDSCFENARIISIEKEKIECALKDGYIVVVAGFQGVNQLMDITTLGPGASDLTAVAIANAINADVCRLYKDTGAIFSTDTKIPGIKPRLIESLSYDELIELSSCGAKVVNSRSAIMAKIYGVTLEIVPEDNSNEGKTIIMSEEKVNTDERHIVQGIVLNTEETLVTIFEIEDKAGMAGKIFRNLADRGINVNLIVQNINEKTTKNLSFTIPHSSINKVEESLADLSLKEEVGFSKVKTDTEIATVSLIGTGIRSSIGVAADVFDILGKNKINIQAISTSEIKISILIKKEEGQKAVQALHQYFCE